MDDEVLFGKAILHMLHRTAMSREQLALGAGGMKKETLDKKIAGKTKTRANTRKQIIEAFGISLESFARIERAIAKGDDPTAIHDGQSGHEDLDAVLSKIVESIAGLTLPVARSIVKAFDEDAEEKSPGEIEQILRRKAGEYQELKLQIQMLKGDDPRVGRLRQTSLEQIEAGRFDEALATLRLAQNIDRTARLEVERSVGTRRMSEAETLLSQARLSSLMSNYAEAVELCIEAHDVVRGLDRTLEDRTLLDAARYLDLDANDLGKPESETANMEKIEREILPLTQASSEKTKSEIRYYLADLYSLLGYRTGDKRLLLRAASIFRENLQRLSADDKGEQRLDNATRLGDTHVEIALTRSSARQAALGVTILRQGIEQSKAQVRPVEVATGYIRLGTALANLGLLSNKNEHFEEAAEAYEAAIALVDDKMDQSVQARAYWGLAIAFSDLGGRTGSVALLKRSEEACKEAMSYLTRTRFPVDWATLMNNRGNARLERGKLENGVATLHEAIADYDAALELRTEDRFLLGFIKSKGNRAITKRVIAERTGNLQLATEARDDLAHVVPLSADSSYWARYYADELARAADVVRELGERGAA